MLWFVTGPSWWQIHSTDISCKPLPEKKNLGPPRRQLYNCEGTDTSLWTKRCAAFRHTVWGFYYINFGGKLIYTARLWAQILRASEAIWAAILPQMPQNFSHMYWNMSSNRYVSRFYEQSSEWPKFMTINSTAQPIETHGKLAGVFP